MLDATKPLNAPTAAVLDRLAAVVGPNHALRDPADQAPYLTEWRDLYTGRTPLVLRPGSTAEVSAILSIANEARIGIVPQGGNTGLVGGQIPFEHGRDVVLSLTRLNRIRHLDQTGSHLVAEAGVTLLAAQHAAEAADRMFPLSLASEGSCLRSSLRTVSPPTPESKTPMGRVRGSATRRATCAAARRGRSRARRWPC